MIDPKNFISNDELKKYTIELILKIKECNSLKNNYPNEFIFFKKLLQRHPEKERKGVFELKDIIFSKFSKAQRILTYSDIQIFILKNDDTIVSISWNKCVKQQDNSNQQKLVWAMRHSIEDQVKLFKKNNNKMCEFCGTTKYLTVDHIIKFKKMAEDFIDSNPDYPSKFDKNELSQEVFRIEDFVYKNNWQKYHEKYAELRILCQECNLGLEI